jgi:4-alpha-glucanotransferase
MSRAAGVLLHPTCLPGPCPTGDLGSRAVEFVSWLAAAGQSYWQVLPLGPVGGSGSPYDSCSAFAGNPLLISPERLVDEGLAKEIPSLAESAGKIDFPALSRDRESLLREIWRRGADSLPNSIRCRHEAFLSDRQVRAWLDDWTLYTALKSDLGGEPWNRWPMALRLREEDALTDARSRLSDEIDFQRFVQFLFFDHWSTLRESAREQGVRIVGDLAIYVALDSADVWANQEIFDLDAEGRPREVAGVPPDYFAATGQRWGNPLYRWDRLAESGFDWWIERLGWSLRQSDLVRLDHFRGFEAFWAIPADEETAVNGYWRPGPGLDLFSAAEAVLGRLPLIAEDLGVITANVTALRKAAGFPGMRVLQFGFDKASSSHRPHCVTPDTVIYTGTHDNATTTGWFEDLEEGARQRVLDYVGGSPDEIAWSLLRAAFTSAADTAIAPLQDVLGLDDSARLNRPGMAENQWTWRLSGMPDLQTAEPATKDPSLSTRVSASSLALGCRIAPGRLPEHRMTGAAEPHRTDKLHGLSSGRERADDRASPTRGEVHEVFSEALHALLAARGSGRALPLRLGRRARAREDSVADRERRLLASRRRSRSPRSTLRIPGARTIRAPERPSFQPRQTADRPESHGGPPRTPTG